MQKSRKRPQVLCLSLSKEEKKMLTKLAANRGQAMSVVLRTLIRGQFLNECVYREVDNSGKEENNADTD